jgi:hypothetical protein
MYVLGFVAPKPAANHHQYAETIWYYADYTTTYENNK